jgi:hypothetical protein
MLELGLLPSFHALAFFTAKVEIFSKSNTSVLFLSNALRVNGAISSPPYRTDVMEKAMKWKSASMMNSVAALLGVVTKWPKTGLFLFPQ